jgi:hypothetical protein
MTGIRTFVGVTLVVSAIAWTPLPARAAAASIPVPVSATLTLTTAVSSGSVRLSWDSDGDEGLHEQLYRWVVSIRPGPTRPPKHAQPTVVLPAATLSYLVTGLRSGEPYTATVRSEDKAGALSAPVTITFSTRQAVTHSQVTHDGNSVVGTVPLTTGTTTQASTVVTASGRRQVLYTARGRVYFSAASLTGRWTDPVELASGQYLRPGTVYLARNRGALVAGWQNFGQPQYRIRPAGSTSWSRIHSLGRPGHLRGIEIDGSGHVHALVGIYYVTNATGRLVVSRVPTSSLHYASAERSRLTMDPVTGRLIVADAVQPRDDPRALLLRLVSVRPSATTVGPWHTVRRLPNVVFGSRVDIFTPVVSSYDGSITLGLSASERVSFPPGVRRAFDGVFVMSGHGVADVSGFRRVPGTNRTASGLVLSASSRNVTELAWSEHDATWRPARQGVFTAVLTNPGGSGAVSAAIHQSRSAYATASGVGADRGGDLFLAYVVAFRGGNSVELP